MSSFQLQNSEVLARLKPFGISFEKSLSDLIKGIRSHSKESPESLSIFLDSAILECKNELTTTDLETKAMAILKLTYLEMYGFDMSWCNFQVLEVMSSSKFQQKRIGYLAAIQSFKNEQDLLILATNQFKKDLNSRNHIEIGLALSGIATIVTPNLSKDINDDVLMKLNHSKPYIRKKAILAMYKIFLQYPDSLRSNFNRIIEKLDDDDTSVVSATINVICEISKKNPNIFLNYLPKFFFILESTKNNWLIIRILKLFQSLSKVEPRMKKKIMPTLMDLMTKTQASSLIYECINCIVNGEMLSVDSNKNKDIAKFCIERIMTFFDTKDSNLKFVGLLLLINILKIFPVFIHKTKGVSKVIMGCLTDPDLIIKKKALEVCNYLVTEDNISDVIKILLLQLIPNEEKTIPDTLKLDITRKILTIASDSNYSNIPNFKWYTAVLKDIINLTLLPKNSAKSLSVSTSIADTIAKMIGKEFKTLATKVPSIRSNILVDVVSVAVLDLKIIKSCPSLLEDFYWILGEYINELKIRVDEGDKEESLVGESDEICPEIHNLEFKLTLFNTLVNARIDKILRLNINAIYPISTELIMLQESSVLIVLIQSLVKVLSSIVADFINIYGVDGVLPVVKYNEVAYYLYKLIGFLGNWESHDNFEVQERALSWLEILKLCLEALTKNDYSQVKLLESKEVESCKAISKKKSIDYEDERNSNSDDSSDGEDSDEIEDESESESEIDSGDESEIDSVEVESHIAIEAANNEWEIKKDSLLKDTSIENVVETEQDNDSAFEGKLPVLLTHVLPSFFNIYDLNPISQNSQRNINIPIDLDLDTKLSIDFEATSDNDDPIFEDSYSVYLTEDDEDALENSDISEVDDIKKRDRIDRMKDDPYYISSTDKKKEKSKKKANKILVSEEDRFGAEKLNDDIVRDIKTTKKSKSKKLKKEKVVILAEESLGDDIPIFSKDNRIKSKDQKKKKNILKIDSSKLDNFDLHSSSVSDNVSMDTGKDFEYNIDLEEMRRKLAKGQDKEKKSKKSKKKSDNLAESSELKLKKKSKSKSNKQKEQNEETDQHPSSKQIESTDFEENKESGSNATPVDHSIDSSLPKLEPVTVRKSKKKKKGKALITE